MKKSFLCIITVLLFFIFAPMQLKAGTDNDPATEASIGIAEPSESVVLLARLDEINEMDKSDLNSSQKKELRKEVREIKNTLMTNGGVVYLSAGALIIALLLIILLL